MEVRVAPSLLRLRGPERGIFAGSPNDVRGGGKRSGGNVSVGRSAPQVVPHSLTITFPAYCLPGRQVSTRMVDVKEECSKLTGG